MGNCRFPIEKIILEDFQIKTYEILMNVSWDFDLNHYDFEAIETLLFYQKL